MNSKSNAGTPALGDAASALLSGGVNGSGAAASHSASTGRTRAQESSSSGGGVLSGDYGGSFGTGGGGGGTYFGSGGFGSDFVDIVISDPLHFDPLVFDCWLQGRRPEFAIDAKLSYNNKQKRPSSNATSAGPAPPLPQSNATAFSSPAPHARQQSTHASTPMVPPSSTSGAAGVAGSPPSSSSQSMLLNASSSRRYDAYPEDDVDVTWRSDPLLLELLRHDVLDQYHTFEILEHYVKHPSLLAQQTMTHIAPPARAYMVERYFALDEPAAREVLSRRMGRSRKDLEEVCEASGLSLNAVTRHVDNIRRIYNHADDADPPSNLIALIEAEFYLPTALARQYACIVFLLLGKFNVASKKRLQRAPLGSLVACAAATLACLTTSASVFSQMWSSALVHSTNAQNVKSAATWNSVWRLASVTTVREIDKDLLLSLREMKQVLLASNESIDGACTLVKASMSGADAATGLAVLNKTNAKLTSIIRQLLKNLLAIGSNLSQPRELRDVYEDIISKVAEPLEEAGLTEPEAVFLLECFRSVSSQIQRPRPLIKGVNVSTPTLLPTSSIDGSTHSVSTVGVGPQNLDVNILPTAPTLSSSSSNSYVSAVYVDWCRYLTFCKLSLSQLYS